MTKESFAKTILRLRKGKKWSQQKLADMAEVSYQTVFRAEAGTMPRIENLKKLANALGVSEGELLTGEPQAKKAELSPDTIQAIRDVVKESLEESRSPILPDAIDNAEYIDELKSDAELSKIEDLFSLIPRLDDSQLDTTLQLVRALLASRARSD